MEEINVMLDEGAIMPTRAHEEDAGLATEAAIRQQMRREGEENDG